MFKAQENYIKIYFELKKYYIYIILVNGTDTKSFNFFK